MKPYCANAERSWRLCVAGDDKRRPYEKARVPKTEEQVERRWRLSGAGDDKRRPYEKARG